MGIIFAVLCCVDALPDRLTQFVLWLPFASRIQASVLRVLRRYLKTVEEHSTTVSTTVTFAVPLVTLQVPKPKPSNRKPSWFFRRINRSSSTKPSSVLNVEY